MPEPSQPAAEKAVPEQVGEEPPQSDQIPSGLKAIFISGPTQQLFQCVTDSDVSEENPFKLISKTAILEDFKNRAAISDFHPVKKVVQEYPGEDLLLVYDHEYKYGENFYICLTEEAKELVLNPPKPEGVAEGEGGEEEEDEAVEIPQTPEPREWLCLGSDLEILDQRVTNARQQLKFSFLRKRRFFNAPCNFSDCNAGALPESVVHIAPVEDENFELQRMELDRGMQAVPVLQDGCTQTEWARPRNKAVQYEPRGMEEKQAQEVLASSEMEVFLSAASRRLDLALQQNEICDIFVDDYTALPETDGIVVDRMDNAIKEYQSYTDLTFSKDKIITWIDWHPSLKGIVAVSCGVNYSANERVDLSSKLLLSRHLILVWSFSDPIHPVLFLEAPDDIQCFKFNPYKPHFIAGGCLNGLIVLWDISAHEDKFQFNKPLQAADTKSNAAAMAAFETDPKLSHAPMVQCCVLSNIENSHRRPVYDIQWMPPQLEIDPKSGEVMKSNEQAQAECLQLVSAGTDGTVMFWDLRPPPPKPGTKPPDPSVPSHLHLNLTWKPFIKVNLPRTDYPGDFAAMRVSLREALDLPLFKEQGPDITRKGKKQASKDGGTDLDTNFFVGTEDGEIVYATWSLTKDTESGKMIAQRPKYHFNHHSGPVLCLQRSPFFKDIVLSVGGWSFAVWKEGCEHDALMKSKNSSVRLTGGAWSPTRPGVFYIIKWNGNIDVWDLLEKSHEPSHSQNISSTCLTAITPIAFSYKQHLLAVGDQTGTLHILEVPWTLRHPSSGEYPVIESLFEREAKRVVYVDGRVRMRAQEKKEKDEKEASHKQKAEKEKGLTEKAEDVAEKDYLGYLDLENQLLIELGLRIKDSPQEEDAV